MSIFLQKLIFLILSPKIFNLPKPYLHHLPFLLLLFSLFSSYGQKEAAIWYFGENAGLDFRSGVPVALEDGALSTLEGCATIFDTEGNLLFYTDGSTVWNRNHLVMPNGTQLLGNATSTQSAIIVPKPNDSDIFYVFTEDMKEISMGSITLKLICGLTAAWEKSRSKM